MRVFLDVGAHEGQTLEEVTKPHYCFDRIHAFEPMPGQYATLCQRYGDRPGVHLENYGLLDHTGPVTVYGDNENMGASVYAAKRDVDEAVTTVVHVMRSSDWFAANLRAGETIVMKLNCEGAEVPILLDLCESGRIHLVTNLLIDFDVRKVEGMEDEEDHVLDRLEEVGFDRYVRADSVMVGATHQDRIAAWLYGTS